MKNLIIVSPHPDDECLYGGGLLAKARMKGIEVYSIYATSGGNGRTLGLVPSEDLERKRIDEARSALNALGGGNAVFLDYKDYNPETATSLGWDNFEENFLRSIGSILSSDSLIVTMPPNGMNGHPDHIRTYKEVVSLAAKHDVPIMFFSSPEIIDYPDKPGFMDSALRNMNHLKPTHRLSVSADVANKKLNALSCYETQALSILGFIRRAEGNIFTEHYTFAEEPSRQLRETFDMLEIKPLPCVVENIPRQELTSTEVSKKTTGDFIDVMERKDAPPLSTGYRYFDMIGGEKNIRMFIAPETMLRGEFMQRYEHLLDESLTPVFACDGVTVRQDMAYAVPGFYIISPTKHYSSFDEMPPLENLRLANIKYWIRKGMREALDLEHVHVYYEETEGLRHSHDWILPIFNISASKRIYDLEVNGYLESFKFSEERERILYFNKKMRDYIAEIDLAEKDRQLIRSFSQNNLQTPQSPNI